MSDESLCQDCGDPGCTYAGRLLLRILNTPMKDALGVLEDALEKAKMHGASPPSTEHWMTRYIDCTPSESEVPITRHVDPTDPLWDIPDEYVDSAESFMRELEYRDDEGIRQALARLLYSKAKEARQKVLTAPPDLTTRAERLTKALGYTVEQKAHDTILEELQQAVKLERDDCIRVVITTGDVPIGKLKAICNRIDRRG